MVFGAVDQRVCVSDAALAGGGCLGGAYKKSHAKKAMSEKREEKQKIEPIRRVRGMQDFLPARAAGLRRIARIAEDVSRLYGFERIEIPILERASLYKRSLGLGSDVVMKEMYAFEDKNKDKDELCLRPEGTAGVMRMLIEQGLTQTLPQRWFYEGAMFRRERPQKGRFRQFHQCGVEYLHKPVRNVYDISKEIEVVACAWRFLKELGLQDIVELKVNWLGSAEERKDYGEELKRYFQQYADDDTLSHDSIERLKRNPLRILDSKDPDDRKVIKKAPPFKLKEYSQDNFNAIQKHLWDLEISCFYDSNLVRGLDYYNGFVFEFVEKGTERAQATVLAGGRYDGLCVELGGKNSVNAIGWAAGLERLLELRVINKIEKLDSHIKTMCLVGAGSFDRDEFVDFVESHRDDFYKNSAYKVAFPIIHSYEEAEKMKAIYIIDIVKTLEDVYECNILNMATEKEEEHGVEVPRLKDWLKDVFGEDNEDP